MEFVAISPKSPCLNVMGGGGGGGKKKKFETAVRIEYFACNKRMWLETLI